MQRNRIGELHASRRWHDGELTTCVVAIALFRDESSGRYAQSTSGNSVGQPMGIVLHPRVRRAGCDAVSEHSSYETISIGTGLGERRADSEGNGSMHGRKGVATLTERAMIPADVRALASGYLL